MIVIAIIVIIFGMFVSYTHFSLLKMLDNINKIWEEISFLLSEKIEIIPEIENILKICLIYEEGLLACLNEMKNTLVNSQSPEENFHNSASLNEILDRIYCVADSFEEISYNEDYQSLKDSLKEIDLEIDELKQKRLVAISKYNDSLENKKYIIAVSIFEHKKYRDVV